MGLSSNSFSSVDKLKKYSKEYIRIRMFRKAIAFHQMKTNAFSKRHFDQAKLNIIRLSLGHSCLTVNPPRIHRNLVAIWHEVPNKMLPQVLMIIIVFDLLSAFCLKISTIPDIYSTSSSRRKTFTLPNLQLYCRFLF